MPDHVYVHIWDNNANVYGKYDAALEGICKGYDDDQLPQIRQALSVAREHPGEASYLDEGMGNVRYLSVTERSLDLT